MSALAWSPRVAEVEVGSQESGGQKDQIRRPNYEILGQQSQAWAR